MLDKGANSTHAHCRTQCRPSLNATLPMIVFDCVCGLKSGHLQSSTYLPDIMRSSCGAHNVSAHSGPSTVDKMLQIGPPPLIQSARTSPSKGAFSALNRSEDGQRAGGGWRGVPQFINAIYEAVARKRFKPKKAACEIPLRVFASPSGLCRAPGSRR